MTTSLPTTATLGTWVCSHNLVAASRALFATGVLVSPFATTAFAEDPPPPEAATGFEARDAATAQTFMVAAANPLAAEAGAQVLRDGGSAVDAAIAVQLVLNLVEPQSSGIGGGAFMLAYDASTGQVDAYDGREKAPMEATEALFLDEAGEPLPFWDAVVGGRSVGVPGLLRLLEAAHLDHGTVPWGRPAPTGDLAC